MTVRSTSPPEIEGKYEPADEAHWRQLLRERYEDLEDLEGFLVELRRVVSKFPNTTEEEYDRVQQASVFRSLPIDEHTGLAKISALEHRIATHRSLLWEGIPSDFQWAEPFSPKSLPESSDQAGLPVEEAERRQRPPTPEVRTDRESAHVSLAELFPFLGEIGALAESAIPALGSGVFDAYADSIDAAMESGHFAADEFGVAIRNVAGSSLRSVGQQAAAKGGFELGEGFGALADRDDSASAHFRTAAKFFGVAALAGVGAGALSTGGAKAGGSSPAEEARASAPEPRRPASTGPRRAQRVQRILVIGDPSDDEIKDAFANARMRRE